jgi:hypothetical protein
LTTSASNEAGSSPDASTTIVAGRARATASNDWVGFPIAGEPLSKQQAGAQTRSQSFHTGS